MGNYLVAMEAAWLVRDVDAIDDAIGVAVSEAGKRLNSEDMDYVEVEVGATGCPACGEPFDSAFIAADTALVGLGLEMEVFNADGEEHASRIAKSEVGGALRDVPLSSSKSSKPKKTTSSRRAQRRERRLTQSSFYNP